MASTHSPTVRRRRLALELRRLREAAGLTCEDVAAQLDCSASKISRIETGRVLVSPRDARDLLKIYGVPEAQREGLIQLARDSRQRGWWHSFGDAVPPHLATYLGFETAASEIRIYKTCRLPSLLQTENYGLAIGGVGRGTTWHWQEGYIPLIMERQRQARASQPRVWVVLDEAVLRRQVGGRDIMREQLQHLIDMAATPNVFLQVIPFTVGAYVAMDLPFVIFGFPDEFDPDVVGIGYPTGALWIEDTAEVDRYNMFFQHLQAVGLPSDDSAALVASALRELAAL